MLLGKTTGLAQTTPPKERKSITRPKLRIEQEESKNNTANLIGGQVRRPFFRPPIPAPIEKSPRKVGINRHERKQQNQQSQPRNLAENNDYPLAKRMHHKDSEREFDDVLESII